jgi:hypothetical protein
MYKYEIKILLLSIRKYFRIGKLHVPSQNSTGPCNLNAEKTLLLLFFLLQIVIRRLDLLIM